MADNQNINLNVSKLGMDLNSREGELKPNSYRYLINGNIQDKGGDIFNITNEMSNILCTGFKNGFKVNNVTNIPSLSKAIYFLVNPATQSSEIGEISYINYSVTEDKQYSCDVCNNPTTEDPPLETLPQKENCNYTTIVNADCLGFSIDSPIQSWVKVDDCNIRIYFTDNTFTGLRYIDYDYQKKTISNCPLVETDELDCDKIKVFKDVCYPKIQHEVVRAGGENKAGTYQFAIAYSDSLGNPIGHYFYVTNPIPLSDREITVETDYIVNQTIQLTIYDLSQEFQNFNIVVIKTINNTSSVHLVQTLSVTDQVITYNYTGVDRNLIQDLSIDQIFARYPYYSQAELITESNGYVLWGNVKQDRIFNLQPVVNNLRLKWITVELNEGDYKNPILASKYRSNLRDEVYSYSVEFTKTNGQSTARFHLPGPTKAEVNAQLPSGHTTDDIISNNDVIQVDNCDTALDLRWQVYNLASEDQGFPCGYEVPITSEIEVTDTLICTSYQYGGLLTTPTGDPIPVPTDCWTSYLQEEHCYDDLLSQYPPLLGTPALISSTPRVVTPSFTYEQCHYEEDIATPVAPLPPYTRIQDTAVPPTITTPNAWILPTNITCGGGMFISPQGNDTCNRTVGLPFYGYLRYIASPSIAPTSACAGAGFSDNAVWYNFTATAMNHAISIGYDTTAYGTDLILEVYDNDCTTLLGCANNTNNFYFVNNSFPFIIGNNYKVKVYNLDPTFAINPALAGIGSYFDICINTPIPDGTPCEEITVPAVYVLECTYEIRYNSTQTIDNNCNGVVYKKGNFGYWESSERYPCNEEVWGPLADTPIRHYKFPDFNISPFYRNNTPIDPNSQESYQVKNKIYPIGVTIDITTVKEALDNAVTLGLISEQEKLSICGFRILRGNRAGNQSIIGKGLLYDVWNYVDNTTQAGLQVLYPNYPYNDFNQDIFLSRLPLKNADQAELANKPYITTFSQLHPYRSQDYKNNKYTFHSPNTHFNRPSLGTELKLECEQFGFSYGSYNKVNKHAEYQLVGSGLSAAALGFATTETSISSINNLLQTNVSINTTVLGSGTSVPLGYILSAIALNISAPSEIVNHYYEWLELLQKFAPFRNYAQTYSSVGKYVNSAIPQDFNDGNTRRRLLNTSYLGSGIFNVQDGDKFIKFNNARRESSAYLNIDKFFTSTLNKDYSRWAPGCYDYYTNTTLDCNANNLYRPISSYYASLKNYNPSQYGSINHIEYLDTGYNGEIDWTNLEQDTLCDPIFGGDTFINRFSLKIKHPFFIEERVSINPSTSYLDNADVFYSELYNVAYPKFFFNYPTGADSSDNSGSSLFANVGIKSNKRLDYNLTCEDSTGNSLAVAGNTLGAVASGGAAGAGIISIPITFGILTRLNFAGQEPGKAPVFIKGKMFLYSYGIPSFLVESDYNLDLRHGENFKEKSFYPYVGDPNTWTQETNVPIFEDNYYSYNTTYSKQNKENLGYILSPSYSREKEDCKVINDNRIIYSLQDNDNNDNYDGNLIYLANNHIDIPKSGGKITQIRGTNNNTIIVLQEDQATFYNSFVQLQTNLGTSFVGTNKLFAQQPQQYKKTDLGFGGSQHTAFVSTEFGQYWVDAKRGAIIHHQGQGQIQPVGYKLASNWLKENLPFKILKDFPTINTNNNFKWFGISMTWDERFKRVLITKRDHQLKQEYKGKITLQDNKFFLDSTEILPSNNTYFTNQCWTIGYYPQIDTIISFYTYLPNYYSPAFNYFSSGVNYKPNNLHEEGLWSHLLTPKSYQVFYGHLHPFMFEYQSEDKYVNQILQSVSFNTDLRRYTTEYDFYKIEDKTFSKALIYNQNQSSGTLNLIVKEKNNFYQSSKYPRIALNSKDILTENVENNFRFNTFEDLSQNNNQPLVKYITNPMYKESNILSISYAPKYLTVPLRSDFFNIRLENDKLSNYQFLLKFQLNKTNQSII